MTLIFKTLYGSHLYGTNTSKSDHDYKAVYLPSKCEILLGTIQANRNENTRSHAEGKNTSADIDFEIFSLSEFVRLLLENQTMALDMIFSPQSMWVTQPHPIWQNLLDNRAHFFSRNVKAFVGYAIKQAGKYGIKGSRMGAIQAARDAFSTLPSTEKLGDCGLEAIAELLRKDGGEGIIRLVLPDNGMPGTPMLEVCGRKIQYTLTMKEARSIIERIWEKYGERSRQAMNNDGVDWKALSHAVRCIVEAKEYLQTGNITLPLRSDDLKLVLAIKLGEVRYASVAEIIEKGVVEIESAARSSALPLKPDTSFAENFVLTVHERIVREEI